MTNWTRDGPRLREYSRTHQFAARGAPIISRRRRHRRNPIADQCHTFVVHKPLSKFRHHDTWMGRGDPINQDRLSGWPGTISCARPPDPLPAAIGGFSMPYAVGLCCEAKRSRPELRAGPSGLWQCAQLISSQARARASSVPLWGLAQSASRGAAIGSVALTSAPKLAPVYELIFGPILIGKVTVQVTCLGTDRRHGLAGFVAALTLIRVRDDVVVGPRAAVGMDPAHIHRISGDVEGGVGLLGVPDVRQANPALGIVFKDPGLDQPSAFCGVAASRGNANVLAITVPTGNANTLSALKVACAPGGNFTNRYLSA